MAAPSKPRTEIPAAKLDSDSPWTEEVTVFIDDNTTHNDERIGIPVAPANRQANHRHRGLGVDGSDIIELTPQENLVIGSDGIGWTPTVQGVADKLSFRAALREITRSGITPATAKAAHKALVSPVGLIKSSGGKGRFTCSMHMKREAAASGVVGGTLRFGLWDGSVFITGAFIDIAFDNVTQEYKRFFFISDQIARPAALNLRSEWVADPSDWDTISRNDLVGQHGGYMVTNGAGLAKWDISHLDGGGDAYAGTGYWWDEVITLSQQNP